MNRVALNATGIWPDEKGERSLKYLRTPLIALWVLLGFTLPQMWALQLVLGELQLVVDNLIVNTMSVMSMLKLLFIWKQRKFFDQVVKQTRTDYARPRESWEREVMTKQAGRARMFTLCCYIILISSAMTFMAMPIFGFHIRTINNITDVAEYALPIQTCYPYDLTVSPNYQLTYVIQMFAGSFVSLSFSMPDTIFGAFLFHANGQFEILSQKMVRIMDSKYTKTKESNCVDRMELKRAIRTHVRLFRYIDTIQTTFNLPLLLQVICLSIIMCCLGYGFVNNLKTGGKRPPLIQVVTIAGALFDVMLHLFIYCIASEILVEHSGSIFHSVYKSNWHSSGNKCSRDLIIIMMRSKNPLQITAGKVMNMSLSAYLNILKTSAGYVSMLLAVSGS